jgi:shikimate dehydrogenase
MAADLSPLFLGLFGHPVAHSFSPRIHRAFAAQFGMSLDYQVFDVDLAGFDNALEYFRHHGGTGCNITLPLKGRAFEIAAESGPAAVASQAVNTMSITDQDSWYGDNTDGTGLVNDLGSNIGLDLEQLHICLLGAGGAASGVLGALQDCNPQEIIIANRDIDKAVALAGRSDHAVSTTACSLLDLKKLTPVDLVINATSLGHQGKAPAIPASLFKPGATCYDMNYGTASMPLHQQCDASGINYSDGLGMLLEQAACSFEIWTGVKPSTSDFGW